jgi:hypothetical protein
VRGTAQADRQAQAGEQHPLSLNEYVFHGLPTLCEQYGAGPQLQIRWVT